MADQPIELTDYDPVWSDRFAEQQGRLSDLLKPWLAGEIEHIGSTSVPGLRSKPIVDLPGTERFDPKPTYHPGGGRSWRPAYFRINVSRH
jgi:hypothetical protein